MDFFDMNFSTLFLEKHGKTIYDNICNKIKSESSAKCNEEYIEAIFDIACLNSWGMEDMEVFRFLKDMGKIDNIDINSVKKIHKNSIEEIQKYIKIAQNEALEDEK